MEDTKATPAQATPNAGKADGTGSETPAATKTSDGQINPPEKKEAAQATTAKVDSTDSKVESEPKTDVKTVPEKYDLKLPEKSPLAKDHIDKIASYAKEHGLSNDEAQRLVERESTAVTEYISTQEKELAGKKDTWFKEVESDKELGGANFKENVEIAHRAMTQFASEKFKDTLDNTGLGNHPEVVRTFFRIGKLMSDDKFERGGGVPPTRKSTADVLYGTKEAE